MVTSSHGASEKPTEREGDAAHCAGLPELDALPTLEMISTTTSGRRCE
jgi:hypothetical protein